MKRSIVALIGITCFAFGFGAKSLLYHYRIRLLVVEPRRYATEGATIAGPLDVEPPAVPPMAGAEGSRIAHGPVVTTKPPKPKGFAFPIEATDLALIKRNVGASVTVVGQVKEVFHSERSDTYFLKFTSSRTGFTVVIFKRIAEGFADRSIDLESLSGKRLKIVGVVKDHPKYGLEILLRSVDDITVMH